MEIMLHTGYFNCAFFLGGGHEVKKTVKYVWNYHSNVIGIMTNIIILKCQEVQCTIHDI